MPTESFYNGLYRPPEFMPETTYSDLFIGYRFPAAKLGATTSARVANQIAEVVKRLNTGMKVVEAGVLEPMKFEQIPKQHFEEMGRLAELTGAEITWHFPFEDPSGFINGRLEESERKKVENFMWNFIEKTTKTTKKPGPITIHPVVNPIPPSYFGEGKDMEIGVYNGLEGNIGVVSVKKILSEEEIEKYKDKTPQKALEKLNQEIWRQKLEPLTIRLSEFVKDVKIAQDMEEEKKKKELLLDSIVFRETGGEKRYFHQLTEREKEEILKDKEASKYYSEIKFLDAQLNAVGLAFNHFIEIEKDLFRIAKEGSKRGIVRGSEEEIKKAEEYFNKAIQLKDKNKTEAAIFMENSIHLLSKNIPKIFDFSENVVKEKVAETISNITLKAYESLKDKAPILCLENLFPGMAFSNAESLKSLIEESRERFVQKIKDKVGEKKAKEISEKLIGATWDIGHINIWKKFGVKPEEISIELEKIKPFIKHIHIADNFGFEDSHLPPGMGGIEPEIFGKLKEIVEKQEVKAILEVPTLAVEFGVSPYPYSLAALGSPIYTYAMAPFWNQALAADLPAYFTGYGPILPEKHFEFYGAGFSALPVELGGLTKKEKETFAGVPME